MEDIGLAHLVALVVWGLVIIIIKLIHNEFN